MNNNFEYRFVWCDVNGTENDLGSFADDEQIMKHLIELNGADAFYKASDRLKTNKEFGLYAIKRDPSSWFEMFDMYDLGTDIEYVFDKDIILAVIKHYNFLPMLNSSYNLNYDFYDIVLNDPALKCDKDIIAAIADVDPYALTKLDDDLKTDKNFVLSIVSKCGTFLEHVSPILRDDQDVVIEAISNDINAIKYASERLRFNKKIVAYALNTIVYKLMEGMDVDIVDEISTVMSNTNSECNSYINNYLSNDLKNDISLIKKKNN